MGLLGFVLLLILLIVGSGLVSASETALFSLSSMKIRAFLRDPDVRKKAVATLLSSPRDLLITLIMLNVVMNIMIQNVVASLFGDFSAWALNVGVPLGLTLVFGEVIPKSLGFANNETLSYRMSIPLTKIQKILYPIRKALLEVTNVISRLLFFFLKKEKEISSDELKHALKISKEYGVLDEDEAQLMAGYLQLQDATVKELMRPREEILFYDLDEPLDRLIHLFVDQECTRIPVCDGGLDKVIGIMTSGQFFFYRESIRHSKDLIPFLKKPFFIPEPTLALVVLEQMYEKRESLALVVDEYGSFSGLISLEDLIEVVIGEISDRRDEKSRFTRSAADVIIASGKLELTELESLFGVMIKSDHMVTIGGWLTEQLGDIPKSGTKYMWDGLLFHVLASDKKRVRRIYIRKLHPSELKRKDL